MLTAGASIRVEGDAIIALDKLTVESRDLLDLLTAQPVEDHPTIVRNALCVGASVLLRMQASHTIDLMERRLAETVAKVDGQIGSLPERIEEQFIEGIAADDSEVLELFREVVQTVVAELAAQAKEIKELQKQLDPTKDTTTLGQVMKRLNDKVDPKRSDSVQATVDRTVAEIAKKDGRIAEVVKTVVAETLKPLQDEVLELAKEVRKTEAVQQLLENTTHKGGPFEDAVVARLRPWAQGTGASLDPVGPDNQPGDIVVDVPSTALPPAVRVVIEARDRDDKFGVKRISDTLDKAMVERAAEGGVFIAKSTDGLANEVGDWATGHVKGKPWVATTIDNAHVAVRYVAALIELQALKAARPDIDVNAIGAAATQISTALKDLAQAKRVANDGAHQIETLLDTVRERIMQSVRDLEREVARAQKPALVAVAKA